MENEKVGIYFGALCDPLKKQLSRWGFKKQDVERYQKIADGVTLLQLHGVLPDAQVRKCRQRLIVKIQADNRHNSLREKLNDRHPS